MHRYISTLMYTHTLYCKLYEKRTRFYDVMSSWPPDHLLCYCILQGNLWALGVWGQRALQIGGRHSAHTDTDTFQVMRLSIQVSFPLQAFSSEGFGVSASGMYGRFRKLGVPYLGVLIIRILGLGSPIFGRHCIQWLGPSLIECRISVVLTLEHSRAPIAAVGRIGALA